MERKYSGRNGHSVYCSRNAGLGKDCYICNPPNQRDGIEERASAMIDKPFGTRSMESLMADFARTETAKLTAERDRLKEALRELCEVLKSQPTYESFHEYELSGTPDLCRRCGKYIDHAYHGTALERAKALIDADGIAPPAKPS